MTRFQALFVTGLLALLLLDAVVAAILAAIQGSGVLEAARITLGFTGVLLLILGGVVSGGVRSRAQAGGTARWLVPPSGEKAALAEWHKEGLASSIVPETGMVYGGILAALAFLLYLVPA